MQPTLSMSREDVKALKVDSGQSVAPWIPGACSKGELRHFPLVSLPREEEARRGPYIFPVLFEFLPLILVYFVISALKGGGGVLNESKFFFFNILQLYYGKFKS